MVKSRFLTLLFLVVGGILTGCASSESLQPQGAEPGGRTINADTTRNDGAHQQKEADASRDLDEAISALRAAYVDRAYNEVVRKGQELVEDSLSSQQAGRVYTLLGRAEQARGNHTGALEAFRSARVRTIEAGEQVRHIDRALGESYAALYRWKQAESAFQRVLAAAPRDRATRQALADVYVQSRDWTAAQEQYAQLVRQDSSNGRWWARLGRCALERNQTDRARQSLATAHRLLPQSADVALPLSRLYRAEGKREEATRVIDTTISHQPRDPRLWRRRADLAFERQNYETARRGYTRTLALGDSTATVFRRLGLIEVREERYERALPPLRRSLQRNSTHPRTTLYLGVAYRQVDSLQLASKYLKQTFTLESQGPITTAYVEFAKTKNQQAEVRAAVQAYKTALRLQPQRTELYFQLAQVYDQHYQDKATAVRYYRRFLQASDTTQKKLRAYTQNRLDDLRPILHMQGDQLQTSDSTDEQ